MYDRKGDGKLFSLIGFKSKCLLAMLSSSSLNEFCYSNEQYCNMTVKARILRLKVQ